MRYILLLFMFIASALVQAQDFTNLAIDGLVKEEGGGKLTGAKVALYQDGKQVDVQTSERNGRFEFFLDFDHEFTIRVSKSGFVEKIIYVNTHGVPQDEQAFGYEWPITVELFNRIEGVDYSLLDKPIGKIYYEENVQNFVGDNAYMRQIQDELKRLENAQKAAEKAKELRKEQLEEDFMLALKDAELAMKDGDYLTAKDNLLAAESIKEGSQEVKVLLAEVNNKLEEVGQKDDQYFSALATADKAFGNGQWETALSAYNEAASIKPGEQYPQNRIAESRDKLAKQRLAEEAVNQKEVKEREYNGLITKADAAYDRGDFRNAKTFYQNALAIKEDDYPKGRIALAEEAIENAAQNAMAEQQAAQLDAQFNDRIDKANTAFESGNYSNAKTMYNEALALKPDARFPKERLDEIDERIAAIAAQQAEEAKMAQLEQLYQQDLREGEKSLRDGQLDAAARFFEHALSLKPQEQLPKQRLADIETERTRLAALEKASAEKAANDQEYKAVLESADRAFNAKSYQEAKAGYEEALALKPREAYPDAQLKKVEQALRMQAKQQENQNAYASYMTSADEQINNEAFEAAVESLREALKIKPDDKTALKKLGEVDKAIEEQRRLAKLEAERSARENEFKRLITDADNAFELEQYQLALNKYKDALAIQDDAYANEQLGKVRQALNKLEDESNRLEMEKERKRKYASTIQKAQAELTAGLYDQAKATYNLAGNFAAEETEHLDGLKRLDELLDQKAAEAERIAAMQAEQERKEALRGQFNALMSEGNQLMAQGTYKDARNKFEEANRLIPEDPTPADKLKQLEGLEQEAEEKRKKADFNAVVLKADKAFIDGDLDEALVLYREAVGMEKSSTHVQERIVKCQQLIAERDATKTVAEEESRRRVIEETYDEGRTKVTIRRVVEEGKEKVYKRVVHSWGGKYYFLDDQPITELVWNRETAK